MHKHDKGFTLVETLVYLFITAVLMLVISGLVVNVLNVRKKIRASNEVQNSARYMINFISSHVHNVDLITDVSPDPDHLHFYKMPDVRFSLALESNNLVYRETQDTGGGFPDQSTATPIILNTNQVTVDTFSLTPITDSEGNSNQGTLISFTLTTGSIADLHGHSRQSFNTFISIR